MARKVAILGYAPNVRFAPWNDPTWELWGLNDQPWTMPRIDVLFEIHYPDVIKAEGHWERLGKLDIPVYMQQKFEEIPRSVAYPLAEVAKRYTLAGCEKPYLNCSAAYMLPIAIDSEPTPSEIALFGVNMEQDTEFSHQRPGAEFWIGVAVGRGIKVSVQSTSDLMKVRYLYGFEDEPLSVFKQQCAERRKWLQDNLNVAMQKEQAAHEERLQYLGALSDIEHITKRYTF